jgi:hypothetical protein
LVQIELVERSYGCINGGSVVGFGSDRDTYQAHTLALPCVCPTPVIPPCTQVVLQGDLSPIELRRSEFVAVVTTTVYEDEELQVFNSEKYMDDDEALPSH